MFFKKRREKKYRELTKDQIEDIRMRWDTGIFSITELANRYEVPRAVICGIVRKGSSDGR